MPSPSKPGTLEPLSTPGCARCWHLTGTALLQLNRMEWRMLRQTVLLVQTQVLQVNLSCYTLYGDPPSRCILERVFAMYRPFS